jgi:hypothetical protein
MTNAQAAAHFASLPPDDQAEILLINGDTGSCEVQLIDPPGTNLNDVDPSSLTEKSKKLPTTYQKW